MLVAPAAAQAKRGSIYDLTKATGFERVRFTGDAGSGCAQYAVCGYSGTTTYRIGGTPRGTLVLTRSSSGRVKGSASYRTAGTTTSSVTPPQPGQACTDTVTRNSDVFKLSSTGPSFQNLLLVYHAGAATDYLDTNCAGPNEADVAAAGALPEGSYRAADFFKGTRPGFALSGGTPFTRAGFNSTIEWQLKFKTKARACSPRCTLPAGR
jgi:hypothetical protein